MKPRKKRQSATTTPQPFINGFACASRGSSHMHALPTPVDLGDRDPAMCGARPALGWVEPQDSELVHEYFYCQSCLTEIERMYKKDDQRLTLEDRVRWRGIVNDLQARSSSLPKVEAED